MKYVDIEYEDPITQDRYQIQVKSSAGLIDFKSYAEKFSSVGYKKLYFVVHSPSRELAEYKPIEDNVELILPHRLSQLIVDLGLFNWLIKKIE